MSVKTQRSPTRIGLDGRYLDAHHPGIGRYVYELARALPESLDGLPGAPELRLLVTDRDPGRFDRSALERAGASLVPTPHRPRGPLAPWRLRQAVRALDVGLWHAPFFATSLGAPAPKVVTIYDTIGLLDPRFLGGGWRRLVYRLLLRVALARTTTVITLSEAAAGDLTRRLGVARSRLAVTPAGVSETFRPAAPDDVDALTRRFDLPRRFALYLGTDRPHKNLDRLCRAWRRLRATDRDSDHQLVLAGFGRRTAAAELRDDPEAGIRALGTVAERDLPTLLSAASIFVLPSLVEGFGLPALEAMACGTPVACADAGSLVEVTGHAAVHFDPRDIDSMSRAIGNLLRDTERRRDLRAAGLKRAAGFTWRRTAGATAAAYRSCLEINPRSSWVGLPRARPSRRAGTKSSGRARGQSDLRRRDRRN